MSLGVLLAIGLTGCIPVQPVEPAPPRPDVPAVPIDGRPVREGGDLVMALSAEPDRLDPTTSSSLYTRYVMNTICEKLYDIDAEGELVPQLATALPTVSADGLTVTIPVRTGISFGDGTPFDAAAVATTLQRHLTLETSARKSELGPISSIEVADPATVVVRYEQPFAPLTASLADRAGMIMSPAAIAELGADFGESPVCVGPFRFTERVPQTSINVERDPNYYDADQVHLDSITYRIMTDANIRAANLRSGDVQVADSISPQDVDALQQERGIGVLQIGSLGYQGVTFNLGNVNGVGEPPEPIDTPIASDPRVRQAFALSVDRTTLVNSVFNNWFEPACSPISPDSPYSTPASEACQPHDPARARQLLAEAGVATPYPVTMLVSNNPDTLRLAQALQASVRDGGFEVTIQPVEYSTLLDTQDRGDFEILQLGWSGRIDPHSNMSTFLSTGAGNNVAGYSNPEVDRLLREATQVNDQAVRADLYGQVVEIIQRELPILYLYRQRNLTAYTTDVAGIATYADGVVRLGRAAFLAEEED
ncbi:ABC transporter substrate-binding protein [Pseudonocardia nigra]|uniref:ABC transporter substrate-binding protein n=1 Tax=Pseudonocardia nigra TaxID=1921578 RepID=UPI0027E21C76|nr:ABC transporter substrate-binding protein [Pseudonocardia nigra]